MKQQCHSNKHWMSFFFDILTFGNCAFLELSKQHKLSLKKKSKKKKDEEKEDPNAPCAPTPHPKYTHSQTIVKFMTISRWNTDTSDCTIWHDAGKQNGETMKPNVRCVQGMRLHMLAKPECTEGETCSTCSRHRNLKILFSRILYRICKENHLKERKSPYSGV